MKRLTVLTLIILLLLASCAEAAYDPPPAAEQSEELITSPQATPSSIPSPEPSGEPSLEPEPSPSAWNSEEMIDWLWPQIQGYWAQTYQGKMVDFFLFIDYDSEHKPMMSDGWIESEFGSRGVVTGIEMLDKNIFKLIFMEKYEQYEYTPVFDLNRIHEGILVLNENVIFTFLSKLYDEGYMRQYKTNHSIK
ncbi:MAG: hypothetical protein FWG31_08480 [Oscillospiraceae bacterium]|nr:hypothetical protein [Oscillospiraceae bacterium]